MYLLQMQIISEVIGSSLLMFDALNIVRVGNNTKPGKESKAILSAKP